MTWTEMSGEGKLAAFTVIHIPPTHMAEVGYGRDNPYCSGIVRLNDGPAISAQIMGVDVTKPESIRIDTPLRAEFIEMGERTALVFLVERILIG
ncbi:MAG: OB-fold domain-containing protein [Anaerolineae bacterium]|nr:OB-fold domain-containing protein [Anaerolineae bacterium]